MASRRIALAWSGGKDSALALDRLKRDGHDVVALVNNIDRESARDRAHGVPARVIAEQAASLDIPLVQFHTDWEGYGTSLEVALAHLRKDEDVDAVAFGDIDLQAHREWNEALAERVGVNALFPLWGADHARVVSEFTERGWRAVVVSVKPPLDTAFLGKWLDEPGFVESVTARGASPAGEGGEYHTLVTEGPLFQRRLEIAALDEKEGTDFGYTWLDVDLRAC